MSDVDELRKVSIKAYLERNGAEFKQMGSLFFCSSPFSRDSTWSFAVYPNNSFFDWSTGTGGDILTLVQKLENRQFSDALRHLNKTKDLLPKIEQELVKSPYLRPFENFKLNKYIEHNKHDIAKIENYTKNRGLIRGIFPGKFYQFDDRGEWLKIIGVLFPHYDENLQICGVKIRKLTNDSPRFSARGRMNFYVLENILANHYQKTKIFIVESESSANSLWEIARSNNINCVVLSGGGVSNAQAVIPNKFCDLKDKYLIIDYDGDEELYTKRVALYKGQNLVPIKLQLEKGEDLNSLYCKNLLTNYTNLIFNV
jgi:DNA primase